MDRQNSAACLKCLTRPNFGQEHASVLQWFSRPCHVGMTNCIWHYAKTQND